MSGGLVEERLSRLWLGTLLRWWWPPLMLLGLLLVFCDQGVNPTAKAAEARRPAVARLEPATPPSTAAARIAALGHPDGPPLMTVRGPAASAGTVRAAAVPAWQPADECARLTRPVSARTMTWCPYTAHRLYQTGDWQPGDLTKLMRIMDCESGGNPAAKNPRSTASGLFQFLRSTFAVWGPRAARTYGFSRPGVFYGYDNISAAVLLFKVAGPGPWPTCGRR